MYLQRLLTNEDGLLPPLDVDTYMEDTFKLARAMTVKSLDTADSLNLSIIRTYGQAAIDMDDPSSWKYYKNICGEYHVLTDPPIYIRSLDTHDTILFSKTELEQHPATKKAYSYGSRYYTSLVYQHPDKETLILGILYPANMSVALSRTDGSILSYPSDLVEPHEYTLIAELEGWIKDYLHRWDVKAYAITDPYYPSVRHSVMMGDVVTKILNLRLKRCKTAEVHSFHLKQFFKSHHGLDKYFPYLTRKQAMFLYMNMAYLDRHVGKSDTLAILIEHLLTERGISIGEYSYRGLDSFNEISQNDYYFRFKLLNSSPFQDYLEQVNLPQMLFKESKLAPSNELTNQEEVDEILRMSDSSVMKTKVLESVAIDYVGSERYPLSEMLFDYWGYLSSVDKYKAYIIVKEPIDNQELSISVKDAFIYATILLTRSLGFDQKYLPTYTVNRIQRETKPTVAEIFSLVDKEYLSKDDIGLLDPLYKNYNTFRSVKAFHTYVLELYKHANAGYDLVSTYNNHYSRGMMENALAGYFMTTKLGSLQSVETAPWLLERSLLLDEYSNAECGLLAERIFEEATGFKDDPTLKLSRVQGALIAIMKNLSSYSIQLLAQANEYPLRMLRYSTIRPGKVHDVTKHSVDTYHNFEVIDISISATDTKHLEISGVDTENCIDNSFVPVSILDLPSMDMSKMDTKFTTGYIVRELSNDFYTNSSLRNKGFYGIDFFDALPEEVKNTVLDDLWLVDDLILTQQVFIEELPLDYGVLTPVIFLKNLI